MESERGKYVNSIQCTQYTQIKRYRERQSTNGKINEAMIKWDSNVIAYTRTRTQIQTQTQIQR